MQQSENFLQELPGCILRHSQKLLLPLAQNSTPRAPALGQWGELTLHPLPGQGARSRRLSEPSLTGPAGISLKVSSGTSCSFQGWICCLWRGNVSPGQPASLLHSWHQGLLVWLRANRPSMASPGPTFGIQLTAGGWYLAQLVRTLSPPPRGGPLQKGVVRSRIYSKGPPPFHVCKIPLVLGLLGFFFVSAYNHF